MNMTMARDYEDKAYAMIGITRERAGTPNEYMTGEGIKQGVEASYAQTEVIYKRFNTAKVKEKEIELSIAQYAASNGKDISVNYINGQNERIIQNFVDPNFAFRKLEVFPADDSTKRRELETFKQIILQRNTLDSSLYDLGKVVTSDNFVSLLEYGLEQEKKKQKEVGEQRAHEKELVDMQNQAAQAQTNKANEREDANKQLDRDSQEYIAEVRARATLADSNADADSLDKFFEKESIEQKKRENEISTGLKQQEIDLKTKKQETDVKKNMTNLDFQFLKLREDAKDRVAKQKESQDRVTIARVNT